MEIIMFAISVLVACASLFSLGVLTGRNKKSMEKVQKAQSDLISKKIGSFNITPREHVGIWRSARNKLEDDDFNKKRMDFQKKDGNLRRDATAFNKYDINENKPDAIQKKLKAVDMVVNASVKKLKESRVKQLNSRSNSSVKLAGSCELDLFDSLLGKRPYDFEILDKDGNDRGYSLNSENSKFVQSYLADGTAKVLKSLISGEVSSGMLRADLERDVNQSLNYLNEIRYGLSKKLENIDDIVKYLDDESKTKFLDRMDSCIDSVCNEYAALNESYTAIINQFGADNSKIENFVNSATKELDKIVSSGSFKKRNNTNYASKSQNYTLDDISRMLTSEPSNSNSSKGSQDYDKNVDKLFEIKELLKYKLNDNQDLLDHVNHEVKMEYLNKLSVVVDLCVANSNELYNPVDSLKYSGLKRLGISSNKN